RGFHRWHEWQRVASLARIAVMRRPGSDDLALPASLQAWLDEVRVDATNLLDGDLPAVTFCRITALDISSTRIRELRAAGRDPRFLLPDAVLDIIERENLYRKN